MSTTFKPWNYSRERIGNVRALAIDTKQASVRNRIGGHEISKLFPVTSIQAGAVSLAHVSCCSLLQ